MSKKTLIPIGPYHPLQEEPELFKLYCDGEIVRDIKWETGYNHRGIEKLSESKTYEQVFFLVERICGICSTSHPFAFANAVEEIAEVEVTDRAKYIRSIIGELERIQSHLLWLGLAGHFLGYNTVFMWAWKYREPILDLFEMITGNRNSYAMFKVGGVRRDIENSKIPVIEWKAYQEKRYDKSLIKNNGNSLLLYGPPGTGKTLLAKAVAASTKSMFIEIVGSELVQKFIGEGAKLVKEIFELAREKAPSIVFIDEIDALAAKRIEIGTSGEREVQRTFMQLLAELDGFKPLDNVKIIGATNRKDILDPAIIRPGRLDRLIHVPVPDLDGKMQIFRIHTKNMKLDEDISAKEILERMDNFSGAEIKAVCTEAGYFAIRDKRVNIKKKDILKAIDKVKEEEEHEKGHLRMFG